ncbi:hypothetical protein CDCA_CDCA09G2765 [Cyanidium caldarium]|uniref:Adenylate kinase n=1 Tax=Cyanidium caldarium TaxID=2771 RepID=A0AAV9IXA9_CYACA|nr:hypothetical protein CDCA_CDCA09G2765 [Cyanidium caldarium]
MAFTATRTVLFLLGAPGSGKSTQGARLHRQYSWPHFCVGDWLRKRAALAGAADGTADDVLVAEVLRGGERIVPSRITMTIMQQVLRVEWNELASVAIVDGFPRNVENATALQEAGMSVLGAQRAAYLWLHLPEAEALRRLAGRRRADDVDEAARRRWQTYYRKTLPLQEYLRRERLRPVDASGTEAQVAARITQALHELELLPPPVVADGHASERGR